MADVIDGRARVRDLGHDGRVPRLRRDGHEVVARKVAHAHVRRSIASQDEPDSFQVAVRREQHELVALLQRVALLVEAFFRRLHDL